MSRKVTRSNTPRTRGRRTGRASIASGSQSRGWSPMYAATVRSDGAREWQPPRPSDPTRTSDTAALQPGRAAARRSAPPELHRAHERYHILGEHGRGGLGLVSRAHDRELGRDVAIKELIARGHLHEVRFLREALITARLEHPGIVPVHEAGRWPDGTPFYAMKLVSGRSLRELIAERATVDQRIGLLHHVIAVADAIAYAHGRNIIHRDLKPANIIAGEFGETIVIDWGLAKELASGDESTLGGGPFRTLGDDDLTAAGSVLGTPAYMSPEQERGEPVDQRADVYAIGAMLWELCALDRVPPAGAHRRHRALRAAGIDRDLATIIVKALDPAPARRYSDAGSLAADLKAFKSGARITARSYSLPAMLAHWIRRHRRLALAIAAALVVAVATDIAYVHNISVERDRADTVAVELAAQRADAVGARDALTLRHAELLLHSNPTAAANLLADYRGAAALDAELLRARAQALGIAHVQTSPHGSEIYFAHHLPDGSLLTIGDKTIAMTSISGRTDVLARGLTPYVGGAYAESRHLLAYACDPSAICLLDAVAARPWPTSPDMAAFFPQSFEFSPTGSRLAAVSNRGALAIWDIPEQGTPVLRYRSDAGAQAARFLADETVIVRTARDFQRLRLTGAPSSTPLRGIPAADVTDFDLDRARARVATASSAGVLRIHNLRTGATREAALCRGALAGAVLVPSSPHAAYVCQDGSAGLWDEQRGATTLTTQLEGGGAAVAASRDGRYVMFGGNRGGVRIYDAATQLLISYTGHGNKVLQLLPPSDDSPFLVTGDLGGAIRIWPVPRDSLRTLHHARTRLLYAVPVGGTGPILAVTATSELQWSTPDGRSGALAGHDANHPAIAFPDTGSELAMYASDAIIELWSLDHPAPPRLLATPHGTVTAVTYLADRSLVSAGRDGNILRWSSDGSRSTSLGHIDEPIETLAPVPHSSLLIARGASGIIWKFDAGRATALTTKDRHTRLQFSPDGRWLLTPSSTGLLRVYDLATSRLHASLQLPAAVQDIAFTPDGSRVAIAAGPAVYFLDTQRLLAGATLDATLASSAPWSTLHLEVGSLAFSPDNHWLAITGADALWLYSIDHQQWICEHIGTAENLYGQFTADSRHYVLANTDNDVLLVDLDAVVRDHSIALALRK